MVTDLKLLVDIQQYHLMCFYGATAKVGANCANRDLTPQSEAKYRKFPNKASCSRTIHTENNRGKQGGNSIQPARQADQGAC